MSDLSIRRATREDAEVLATLGRTTFMETFVEGFRVPYTQTDIATYFEKAYSAEAVRKTFDAPKTAWWLASRNGAPVAFAKAGPNGLPHPDARAEHGELKHLYVLREHQGVAAGRELFDRAFTWLEASFDGPLWIGVWSGNEKAQRFYARYGFEKVGEYFFSVGATQDHELIFRRPRAT